MAASYPSSKKTFSQIIDGTTKVKAAGVNVVYDEVEALETMVGAIGSAQSYSESFKNLVLAYRRGCSVDYKGVADLYVRAGEIAIPDASGNVRLRRNPSDTTVTWAMTDSGSPEANSTPYYVYATADDSETIFDIAISTNNSAPAGATYYKKIGAFYNNASGDIEEVANLNRDSKFGNWVTKATNTVYLALTDGYAIATQESNEEANFIILSDGSTPPTTIRGAYADYGNASTKKGCITTPIRQGDYWKVTVSSGTVTVYWLPVS